MTYEELVVQLESGSVTDVVKAAHGLGDLGDRRAVPVLIMLLQGTADPRVRDAAAVALRELGDARAVAPLLRLIQDPKTENHRGTLVYALEPFDCAAHFPLVIELIVGGGFEVSRQAALLLDGIETPIESEALQAGRCAVEDALASAPSDQATLLGEVRDWIDERSGKRAP
jgi:hypothetical protein